MRVVVHAVRASRLAAVGGWVGGCGGCAVGAVCTLSGLKGVEDCREIAAYPMRRERSPRERGGTGRKRGEKGKGERRTDMKGGKEGRAGRKKT